MKNPMSEQNRLNERQRRFCEFYAQNPNAAEAARLAGYAQKNARKIGQRLLTNVDILSYIRQLQDELSEPRIAGVKEAKATLSDIMRDPTQKASIRVKAAEILMKAAGEFLDPRLDEYGWNDTTAVHIYMPHTERDEGCDIRREQM